ncbi:MAG: outer membrane beta-barrel protein [Gemmatimonadaceae bacterium]
MLRLTKLIAVAAITITSATAARAQGASSPTRPFSFGVSGGAAVPTGDLSDVASVGYNVTGSLGLSVPTLPVGLRVDGAYNSFGIKNDLLTGTGAGNVDGNARVLSLTGNLVLPIPLVLIRPYLIGGAGIYNVRLSATATDQNGTSSGSASESKFGFNLGAGVTIRSRASIHSLKRDTTA